MMRTSNAEHVKLCAKLEWKLYFGELDTQCIMYFVWHDVLTFVTF